MMNLQDALHIQREIISILEDSEGILPGTIFQGTLRASTSIDPVAVGFSRIKDDYQVELRVPDDNRRAQRIANAFKEKYKQVNIESPQRIEMPTQQVLRGADTNPKHLPKPGPLQIGLSVGHLDGGAGTLGCFVESGANDICVLSCNHVLALLGAGKSLANTPNLDEVDYIYHPGKEAEIQLRSGYRIGRLRDYVDMSTTDSEIDCAIAEIDEPWEILGNVVPKGYKNAGKRISLIKPETDIMSRLLEIVAQNQPVAKIGKTTGYTEGTLSAINVKNLRVLTGKGYYTFNNVHEIRWHKDKRYNPFTSPGDSGSLIYLAQTHEAFGLHFASDSVDLSYCCDLHRILEGLDIAFWES